MKKFISGFINLVINIFIIAILLIICVIVFVFLISKSNNISVEDTVSYIKSFGNEISNLSLIDTEEINIDLSSSDEYNTNTNISNANNNFYYNQLEDTEKIFYDELENNIDNLKKANYSINFSTRFNGLLNQSDGQHKLNKAFQTSIDAFFYDHPELFYIDMTKLSLLIKSMSIGPITKYTVTIEPQNGNNYLSDYFYSERDVNTAISKVESVKNNLINKLPNTNDYSKALTVHDTLVKSLKYTSSGSNTHNIYGALVDKKVVCEGYAKAFKYILDSLDIECILVGGNATNSSGKTESHMWNYINLNGKWYGVDVTWDDPIIIGNSSSKIIRHDYFCKGSNVFNENHYINPQISDKGKAFSIPTLSNKNYK